MLNPNLSNRQLRILEQAQANGDVMVEPLAEDFQVTPQTIRRDLVSLCNLRLLQRKHGGAVLHDGVANMGYKARTQLMVDEKSVIAGLVSTIIPNDSSLFINIGTTTELVAHSLSQHSGLLVVTNNINVINALRPNQTVQIMTAGGTVRREDGGITGDSTIEFIAQFKVDFAVLGVSAIDDEGSLLEFDSREVSVSRMMIKNARKTILVADEMKFERNAPVRVAELAQIDYLVTNRVPTEKLLNYCEHNGVRVVTPEPQSE